MWQIIYPGSILMQLEVLPFADQRLIFETLQSLHWAKTPRSLYPVRVGNYRILCSVDNVTHMVRVVDVEFKERPI